MLKRNPVLVRSLTCLFGLVLATLVGVRAFTNPILWQDLPDVDLKRVDNTYYYSSSTFHYSPGAPILRSYDLVNWEYFSHSVPFLDFGAQYDMTSGQRNYLGGIWASFFGYHAQKNTWFWGGCINFYHTFIYSSPSVAGPWTQLSLIPDKVKKPVICDGCY